MPVPLVAPGRLGASIYTDRVVCGLAGFEVHLPGGGRAYGTMQGFRVYPRTWRVGMADGLIGLPCRFTLTNSYRFHSRAKAGDKLAMRARHMESAGDRAHSLQEELVEAMDAVDRGEHVMGEHHWSLAVHVDRWEELETAAAAARSRVTDMGAGGRHRGRGDGGGVLRAGPRQPRLPARPCRGRLLGGLRGALLAARPSQGRRGHITGAARCSACAPPAARPTTTACICAMSATRC